jgi:hypothetical protein
MVRLSMSLVLATALTLAGVILAYEAFTRIVPLEFVVSGLAIAVGLTWLWSVIKEWRAKESAKGRWPKSTPRIRCACQAREIPS